MVLYAKDIVETEFLSMPPQRSVLEAAKAMATRRHGFASREANSEHARDEASDERLIRVVPASDLHDAVPDEAPLAAAVEPGRDDSRLRGREPEAHGVAQIQFHRRDGH